MIFDWLSRIFGADPRPEDMPRPVDHGGGLHRLPDPQPETGMIFDVALNKWVLIEDRAAETLAAYREGRWGSEGDRCPRCSQMVSLGNAVYLAQSHPSADARRNWRRAEAEDRLMVFALGDCLCGQEVTEEFARQSAQLFMAPYLGRMGMGG